MPFLACWFIVHFMMCSFVSTGIPYNDGKVSISLDYEASNASYENCPESALTCLLNLFKLVLSFSLKNQCNLPIWLEANMTFLRVDRAFKKYEYFFHLKEILDGVMYAHL